MSDTPDVSALAEGKYPVCPQCCSNDCWMMDWQACYECGFGTKAATALAAQAERIKELKQENERLRIFVKKVSNGTRHCSCWSNEADAILSGKPNDEAARIGGKPDHDRY